MEELYDPLALEKKLAPKLSHAEYILLLVIAVMLWTAGFVDLFTHTTPDGQIFGLYSAPFFILLVLYTLGYAFWFGLIVPRDSITWLKRGLAYIQNHAAVGVTILAALGAILFTMFVWDQWLSYPLLAAAMLILIVVVVGMILLAKPEPHVKMQNWRKVVLVAALAYLGVEGALQIGALFKILPAQNTSGLFVPHGRVYQNREGAANGLTNRYGYYYPPFRLKADARKIVLVGDTFVQALQIQPEQNMGIGLEKQIRKNERDTEVLAIGFPGYGLGLYADPILYPYILKPLSPNEVVVVFHLVNDLQTQTASANTIPQFSVDDQGNVVTHPDDVVTRHTLQHVVITGYEPVKPVQALQSQLFTLTLVDSLWRGFRNQPPLVPTFPANTDSATDTAPFGASSFVFEREGSAASARSMAIVKGLLKNFKQHLDQQGVKMRLVTIPYFPAAFYQQYQGRAWSPALGKYDVFRPERELGPFAQENDIAFLPMGQFIRQAGLNTDEIKALFYKDGTGHLTPQGHAYFAQAMYACFYGADRGACGIE
ncbi:MAG: hypothetical protein HY868_08210 [Chloroflexi bacterium]|nr:hypothetical protein [Chloroflexota bacterium]